MVGAVGWRGGVRSTELAAEFKNAELVPDAAKNLQHAEILNM